MPEAIEPFDRDLAEAWVRDFEVCDQLRDSAPHARTTAARGHGRQRHLDEHVRDATEADWADAIEAALRAAPEATDVIRDDREAWWVAGAPGAERS